MIDVQRLFGQTAVSLGDAEATGTVRGLQFDGNRISFLDIGTGRPIPAEAVRTFEGDALTYETFEGDALTHETFEGDALTHGIDTHEIDDSATEAHTAADRPGEASEPADQVDAVDDEDSVDGLPRVSDDLSSGDPATAEAAATESPPPWSGNPIGSLMLSDMGNELGRLATMYIDERGRVVEILGDQDQRYGGDRLMAVGSFAVVVAESDDPA